MKPNAATLLTWNVVEKRIRHLIAEDVYLNEQEKTEVNKLIVDDDIEEDISVTDNISSEVQEKPVTSKTVQKNIILGNSPKDKFRRNIVAIQTLQSIESENRSA